MSIDGGLLIHDLQIAVEVVLLAAHHVGAQIVGPGSVAAHVEVAAVRSHVGGQNAVLITVNLRGVQQNHLVLRGNPHVGFVELGNIGVIVVNGQTVPGGPFLGEKAISEAAQAALEAKYGLDKPLMEQYFTYLKDIVTKFDFGPSLKLRGRQVLDIIIDGMEVSAKLGLIAAGIALITGIVIKNVDGIAALSVIHKASAVLFMVLTIVLLTFKAVTNKKD